MSCWALQEFLRSSISLKSQSLAVFLTERSSLRVLNSVLLVVSIGKWSAAGKVHTEEQCLTAKSEFSFIKTTDGLKHKWWNAWRTGARDGRQWRIRDTDATSTFFPKVFAMNERTENKVQSFLGKYLTQKTTALLKKAFTLIRTVLPQKTNRFQSSLHRVKRFLHLLWNFAAINKIWSRCIPLLEWVASQQNNEGNSLCNISYFSFGWPGLLLYCKMGCSEHFLVVLDDQLTANFKQCNNTKA